VITQEPSLRRFGAANGVCFESQDKRGVGKLLSYMSRVLPIVASFLPVLSLHRELFIKTRSYGNTFSGECRVTSTTVVIFGRRDLAENMHDVCTIAFLFRYSCSFLTYRDNLQGN